ncbi:hypothetical protein ACE1AT_01155 [Pelatocladus sp. BLCC-F211]|uniref:hypothetical protein n=1 Tax=Pelatocladus sp. BLCC-F211 TaxID=3342752 RepID=UPI0035B8FA18
MIRPAELEQRSRFAEFWLQWLKSLFYPDYGKYQNWRINLRNVGFKFWGNLV